MTRRPVGPSTIAAADAAARERAIELVARWVAETHDHDENGTPAGVLYARFLAWAADHGEHGEWVSATRWGRALTTLGHPARRTSTHNVRPLTRRGGPR